MTHDQALQFVARQSASLQQGRKHHCEAMGRVADKLRDKAARGESLDRVERMAARHYGIEG